MGMETEIFRNALNVRTLWENHITPIFIPATDTIFSRQEFHSRKQGAKESAQEYCSYKLQLFQQGWSVNERSFDTLRKGMISGLRQDIIKEKVNDAAPQNQEALITTICAVTGREQEAYVGGYSRLASTDGLASCLTNYGGNTTAPVEDMEVNRAGDNLKCFYCQRLGHIQAECRKKKRDDQIKQNQGKGTGPNNGTPTSQTCSTCNKRGHLVHLCRAHIQCRACQKYGHYARDCRTAPQGGRAGPQPGQGQQDSTRKPPKVNKMQQEEDDDHYGQDDDHYGQDDDHYDGDQGVGSLHFLG